MQRFLHCSVAMLRRLDHCGFSLASVSVSHYNVPLSVAWQNLQNSSGQSEITLSIISVLNIL